MARKAVFADTSFFFALAAKRDATHEDAVRTLGSLLRAQRPILTTDYVLDEALTLTKARTHARVALALLDRVERSGSLVVESIGPARFEAATTFFRRHSDHSYSFTDCTSFVTMRELRLTAALTTDRHFREAGFQVLLPIA